MKDKVWGFSVVALLVSVLSYEVFANRAQPREQLRIEAFDQRRMEGTYTQESLQLRFEARMEGQAVMAIDLETWRGDYRVVSSEEGLITTQGPGDGMLTSDEARMLFDLAEALKLDAQRRNLQMGEPLVRLVASLSYWATRYTGTSA